VQALEGNFVDKKCPFTGNVGIRGRVLQGTVATMKMTK
jgi:small subunit ribosomal protein S11e